MYSPKPRPNPSKRCHIPEKDLSKFTNTQEQFLKWIMAWERRIFNHDGNILTKKRNCLDSCCISQMNKIETCFKSYQASNANVIGEDHFVWTVFANTLIAKHKGHIHQENTVCTTKLCLLLLFWSSFYLKLPNSKQVKELVREIVVCTGSLNSIFSFLPGMSMVSYISQFITEKHDENSLCEEFFFDIQQNSSHINISLYQSYSPLVLYFIENLTPLHSNTNSNSSPFERRKVCKGNDSAPTLISLLDRTFGTHNRHTLLTLAIEHRDGPLVKLLLQMGASADVKIWNSVTEEITNAEQLLVTSVNSLVASKCFFPKGSNGQHPTVTAIMKKIESATVYGKMLRQSLLCPSTRKADNMWRGESWRQELNTEIADIWGVDCKRPFPSLLHASKITIRHHILQMDRELLPDAVLTLPLPNFLKAYLNLN